MKTSAHIQVFRVFCVPFMASIACATLGDPIHRFIPTASPGPGASTATAKANAARTALAASATAQVEFAGTAQAAAGIPLDPSQAAQTGVAIQPTLVARQQWPLIISDTFTGDVRGWYTGTDDTEYSSSTWAFVDGKYRWEEEARKSDFNFSVEQIFFNRDFYVSVEAERIEGTPDAIYGLILRQSDTGQFYFFAISNRQLYTFFAYDGEWSQVIDWTESAFISPQGVNQLAATAEGSVFWFFVNDHYLGSAYDDSIQNAGFFGVGLLLDEGDQVTLEFDNFVMRRKP